MLYFEAPIISVERLKLEFSNCVCSYRLHQVLALRLQTTANGSDQGHVKFFFNFAAPSHEGVSFIWGLFWGIFYLQIVIGEY